MKSNEYKTGYAAGYRAGERNGIKKYRTDERREFWKDTFLAVISECINNDRWVDSNGKGILAVGGKVQLASTIASEAVMLLDANAPKDK